ncbi:MAG: FecR domain-containing protein [Betaproteobacteria bacterium]|nr:MAG: FecR domain-containing protein [Betaproteobacteria bacterium]
MATAVLFGGPPAWAAEPVGVVTILEGDALAIRGLSKLVLAEGVRIAGDDLVETGKGTFLRIEFTDGAVVDLGPGTRAQLNRPSLKRVDRPALYLLSGWLKLSAGKLPAATKGSFASPQFDALGAVGEVVARVEDSSSKVFAEDGPLQILNRRAGAKAPITIKWRSGRSWTAGWHGIPSGSGFFTRNDSNRSLRRRLLRCRRPPLAARSPLIRLYLQPRPRRALRRLARPDIEAGGPDTTP